MDGKGRCMDNIFVERLWRSLKYEEVYLNAYATVAEAKAGIGAWLAFYNEERQHQSLGYRLSHAAANLPGGPVDIWTIGVADRLRFPRFPSELGKRGSARLRPHTHRHRSQQGI
jgi:putative transposase